MTPTSKSVIENTPINKIPGYANNQYNVFQGDTVTTQSNYHFHDHVDVSTMSWPNDSRLPELPSVVAVWRIKQQN